jgi:hypothetical protein
MGCCSSRKEAGFKYQCAPGQAFKDFPVGNIYWMNRSSVMDAIAIAEEKYGRPVYITEVYQQVCK